jgi:signal transduction histidine kinase
MTISRSKNASAGPPPIHSASGEGLHPEELLMWRATAEERERDRIARILHDELQQVLHGLQMQVHLLGAGNDVPGDRLEPLENEIKAAIRLTRDLTADLSPPVLKREGLLPALHWLRDSMQQRFHFTVDLSLEIEMPKWPSPIESALFQVLRELLFNVHKHSGTDQAKLMVNERNGCILIEVVDAGKGMDTALPDTHGGRGFEEIRERLASIGGCLTLDSKPGEGTRVRMELPQHEAGHSGRERHGKA